MDYPIQLYEIARGAGPGSSPRPLEGRAVIRADTPDAARCAAREQLEAEGRTVRSLSLLAAGGLVAVVYPPDVPGADGGT